MAVENEIESLISEASAGAVGLRHRLHRIPELGFQETKTAAAIRGELDRLGIGYVAGVEGAPTATIATIGDPGRPCVALRADIDALPIEEQTGVSYASEHPGRMHACGHDGHTATLAGVAAVLKRLDDAGALKACVKLMWQPAEEGGGGGERLVKAGVIDGRVGPKVTAVFGLHGWPGLPVGTVATKGGALLAATDTWEVTMTGRGCHGAFPHFGADPIVAAAEAVLSLQMFVSREFDPTDSAVITVGQFNAGTATNIIPDFATLRGTARTLTPEAREKIERSLRRRVAGVAQANGCSADVIWTRGYPPTVNDPAMADYVAAVARKTLGSDRFIAVGRPSMGGEDFSYYLEAVRGCFFLVGVERPGQGPCPPLHSDRFDFADDAIAVGMRMFVSLVQNWT